MTYDTTPQGADTPSDAEILALNVDERYFSESPTKYPEAGHGTQYHAGTHGVVAFARAVLARWGAPQAVGHLLHRVPERIPEEVLHKLSLDYTQTLDLQSFRLGWREAERHHRNRRSTAMTQRWKHPTLTAHLLGLLQGFAELADGLVTISSLGFLCSSFELQVARHRARETC